jgi:hypothetical protein
VLVCLGGPVSVESLDGFTAEFISFLLDCSKTNCSGHQEEQFHHRSERGRGGGGDESIAKI